MKKFILQIIVLIVISLLSFIDCRAQSITTVFKIINGNPSGSNRTYDIYVSNVKRLEEVNTYLSSRLDGPGIDLIQINYYDNAAIAKTYMKKQFSENVSDEEKDRLFKHYIARYLHNHSTGYDQLSFMQ